MIIRVSSFDEKITKLIVAPDLKTLKERGK